MGVVGANVRQRTGPARLSLGLGTERALCQLPGPKSLRAADSGPGPGEYLMTKVRVGFD